MINGIEGIPGSGKSYEAVAYHVLPALEAGRKVITNLPLVVEMFAAINPDYRKLLELRKRAQPIRGTWDASRMDENGNGNAFDLFEDGHVEVPGSAAKPFTGVWDYFTVWKHPETGHGPLFVIDEAHVPLPRVSADSQVREWFALHRHFNVDVLLMSQRFRKIHPDISELTAILVRCRKADILGRKDSYIRKVHSGYPGAVISTEERPYKEQYFPLYKSHTQGNSVAEASASDVKPFSVKFKRFTYAWWVVTVVAIAYVFWPSGDDKAKPKPARRPPVVSSPVVPVVHKPEASGAAQRLQVVEASAPVELDEVDPEHFAGKGVHLTGVIAAGGREVYTFVVSSSGRQIMTLVGADLERAGYTFKPLGYCAGVLTFRAKSRPVTCDGPSLAVGSTSKPFVYDGNPGSKIVEAQR
jgi:zona occludens toxin